jgi:RNA recognition motif-containing protein
VAPGRRELNPHRTNQTIKRFKPFQRKALQTIPEKGSLLMSVKLFVGNLTRETTSTEIRDLFSAVGVVESCQLIANRETGRSKGFGFVEMNSREAADAAKEKFNGHNLHGHTLKVSEAKPRIWK